MAGVKGRSGPKPGNLNAAKNGSKVNRHRLVIGDLPLKLISVRREGRAYRRALETMVEAAKGEITMVDAHLIDSATGATVMAGICRWLMKHKLETMSVSDLLGCNRDIVKAKAARDAAIKQLGLNVPPPEMDLQAYIEVNAKVLTDDSADDTNEGSEHHERD